VPTDDIRERLRFLERSGIDPEMEGDASHRQRRREERGPPEVSDLEQILVLKRLLNLIGIPIGIKNLDRYLAQAKKHDRIDELRKQDVEWSRHTVYLDDLLHEPALTPDPMTSVINKDEIDTLLEFLTPQQHKVIAGLFLDGMTRAEVASLLNISPDAVSKTKDRALEVMRGRASPPRD
jgi:RNA polymerase sigma factor (sigma-70 family)